MWQTYHNVPSLEIALSLLKEHGQKARIVAGATDLLLELERGLHPDVELLIDISRVPGVSEIILDADDVIHLGPLVTHNQVVSSALMQARGMPLAQACWQVGAPQIRNRGTVAGNIITASPANDTISALMALGAGVKLRSADEEWDVPLVDFFTGVRQTVMKPNEILVDIYFPALAAPAARGVFYKLGLRQAQAISVVHLAAVLKFDGDLVSEAAITLGAVAPTIIHASEAEAYLVGKSLSEDVIAQAAALAQAAAKPIDDLRGSAAYRNEIVRVGTEKMLQTLSNKQIESGVPAAPVMLGQFTPKGAGETLFTGQQAIDTTINGKAVHFESGYDKTLLRLLREEGELIGTKEGCAEGECGACTVSLDGQAVMACLVPAPRAHGAEIVTIEGVGRVDNLHPLQQAFIDHGAVQCGYCTPGFVLSAVALLDEKPNPTREEVQTAITGNLCRCTGYYKIVQAIESVGQKE